jgi:hypothetical protein
MHRLVSKSLAAALLFLFVVLQMGHYALDLAHAVKEVHCCPSGSDESSGKTSDAESHGGHCNHGIHSGGSDILLTASEEIAVSRVSSVTWFPGLFQAPEAPVAPIEHPPQIG